MRQIPTARLIFWPQSPRQVQHSGRTKLLVAAVQQISALADAPESELEVQQKRSETLRNDISLTPPFPSVAFLKHARRFSCGRLFYPRRARRPCCSGSRTSWRPGAAGGGGGGGPARSRRRSEKRSHEAFLLPAFLLPAAARSAAAAAAAGTDQASCRALAGSWCRSGCRRGCAPTATAVQSTRMHTWHQRDDAAAV